MKRLLSIFFMSIALMVTLLQTNAIPTAQALSAANWSAGRIIDDQIFADSRAINVDQIQAFLNAKVPACDSNGTKSSGHWYAAANRYYTRAEWGAQSGNPAPYVCLKDYVENLSTGQSNLSNPSAPVPGGLSAAQIIAGASIQYSINPEVILVLLQKEQGLITDDWPWVDQYKKATGAYCPDTAPCDVTHAGFGNQVYSAGRLLRSYIDNPSYYNYAPGVNSILYNPNAGACGSSLVHIETRATAALYNYTPYQPNAAALANLYGTGDSCSAYGNRNFWRMFNDWFGSTTGSVSVVKKDNDATIYLRSKNTVRPIPSMAILEAWGFNANMVSTLDETTFNTLSVVGPNLSQVVKVSGSSDIFFIDSGRHYYVRPESHSVWNFTPENTLALSAETIQVTIGAGTLGNNITASADNGSVYAVDGNQKRAFTSIDAYNTWTGGFGGITHISNNYFSSLTTGSPINTNFFSYNSETYMIDGAVKHKLAGAASGLAPNTLTSMSSRLFNFYFNGSNLTHLLRGSDGGIYLLDGGVKRPIGSIDIAATWRPSAGYTDVSSGALSFIPTGGLWTTNIVRGNDSSVYFIDQEKKYAMTASILEGYTGGSLPPIVSDSLLAIIPTASQQASDFIKSNSDGTIYFLDYGTKRAITSFPDYLALNGSRNQPLQTTSTSALKLIPSGPHTASSFLKSDSSGLVFDDGSYRTLTAQVSSHWPLGTSAVLNNSTLSRYTNAGVLTTKIRSGSSYGLVHNHTLLRTDNASVAGLWGLDTTADPVSNTLMANFRGNVTGLSQFARNAGQPTDRTIYLVDNSKFIPIPSSDLFIGLGANTASITDTPDTLVQAQLATGGEFATLGTVTDGHTYVFDAGKKREIASGFTAHWTSGVGSTNFSSYTSSLISALPAGTSIKRVIRTADGSMYVMQDGKKRPISAYSTYLASFSAEGYSDISDSLARSIATGTTY